MGRGGREGEREGDEMMSGSDSAMKNDPAGWGGGVEVGAGLCALIGSAAHLPVHLRARRDCLKGAATWLPRGKVPSAEEAASAKLLRWKHATPIGGKLGCV